MNVEIDSNIDVTQKYTFIEKKVGKVINTLKRIGLL
jgi:hypothetical protein